MEEICGRVRWSEKGGEERCIRLPELQQKSERESGDQRVWECPWSAKVQLMHKVIRDKVARPSISALPPAASSSPPTPPEAASPTPAPPEAASSTPAPPEATSSTPAPLDPSSNPEECLPPTEG
ncbi:hypothetical protein NE237_011694 [Protea cynaroides]|uniref:Uncharacterized protein n=1 Tax=Protea cynaroides TaxID=273540 RepID=A0A9Q0GXM4_9MAGN|nr:hypothetical protein NE237_011694 [Protea cynaroides]